MLRAIHRRGATVEFFSNAPMWWMTRNDPDDRTLPSNQNLPRRANGTPFAATCRKSAVDNACKSSAGGTLQSWNAGDYAYYLATVVAQARRHWGIRVASIAPFNEPMAADDYQTNEYGERSWYWRYPARQEGVHLEIGQQATILRALRNELDRWGLHDVVIAASDENNAPHAKETFEGLAGLGVADLIGRINVHSYGYSTGKVNPTAPPHDHKHLADALLREAVGNRRVWVSEYGNCEDPTTPCDFANPWDESTNGSLATAILTDLDHLKPSAWLYWQAVEFGDATYTSRWGLVNGAFGREEDATSPYRGTPSYVNNKYFVFAQFTRFLRPGFERLVTRQSCVPVFDVINRSVAAYDRRGGKLVLIWDNRWGPDSVKFDLSAMGPIGCRVASVTATRHDGTMQFHRTTTLVTGNTLTIAAEAGTLYSIVVPGVELSRHARGRDSSDGSGHRSKRTRTDCSVHLDDEDEHGAKRHGHDH